jgi:hypothetical protein
VSFADLHAGWIALAAAAVAVVLLAVFGTIAWRAYARFSRTQEAAEALIDVHTARLEATVVTAGSQMARVTDHGAELTESIADLRANGEHLVWMLRKVPEERDRLKRELLEIILPSGAAADDDDDDRDHARD